MFNWQSETLDLLNLAVVFLTAVLVIKDVRKLHRRYHRKMFGLIGVGEGRMVHNP